MNAPARNGDALKETVLIYFLMFLYGVFNTIIGTSLLRVVEDFSMPLSRGGVFVAVLNAGSFLGLLASGCLVDRFDTRRLISVCYAMFAASMVFMYFAPVLGVFLACFFLAGIFAILVDVLFNTGVARLHSADRGFYMNLLHCSFGIGSFLGPVYAGYVLEKYGTWRLSYFALGLACFALLAAHTVLLRRSGPFGGATERPSPAPLRSLFEPRIVLACLILFCYVSHQSGMNTWFPAHLTGELGMDPVGAGAGLSAFWLGLIISRLAGSFLTRRISDLGIVLAGSTLGGLALLSGVLAGGEISLFAGAAGVGLFSGATIPMLLTQAYSWRPDAHGKMSMLLFMAIVSAGIVFPWFMGVVEGAFGLKAAMVLNGCMLFAAAAATFFLFRICRRYGKESA